MSASELAGVLVVDKPAGPTSHDVVDAVRRAYRLRRVGHTGTLDPFATGVLPVCLGRATRLARFLTGHDKAYRATVRLGFATDTDDLTGRPLAEALPVGASLADVEAAARRFLGRQEQLPPAFSAKQVGGQRLYARARRGESVERRAAWVSFHAIEVVSYEPPELVIDVLCSSGAYVRALARDLGAALGTAGHLAALRRTRSGPFELSLAVGLADVDGDPGRLVPLAELLPDFPAVRLEARQAEAVRHGRALPKALIANDLELEPEARVRLLDESGELLALAVLRLPEGLLQPDVVLAP